MKAKKSGARAKESAPAETFALIPDATLKKLHRRLLQAVGREKAARAHSARSGEHYAAAQVAVGFDLKRGDAVIEQGASRLPDALIAAEICKTRKKGRIALVWGAEAGEQWQDALEAARTRSLPIVFVGDAADEKELRGLRPRTKKKLKPGEEIPCITVDGHDVVAAYRVAHEAIDRARRDRGPTLILLATYKVGGRVFTDAVADMDRYLRGRGLLKAGIKR